MWSRKTENYILSVLFFECWREEGPFWGDGRDRSSPRPSRIPQEMASSPKLQDRCIENDLCVEAFPWRTGGREKLSTDLASVLA